MERSKWHLSVKPIFLLCTALAVVGVLGLSLAIADEDTGLFAIDKGSHVKTLRPHTTQTGGQALVPPANDECAGAYLIPDGATNSGDYPVCSPITTGVQEATPDCAAPSGTDPASCLAPGQYIANTVWYTWTPSISGYYLLIACPAGACGPGGTSTDDDDGTIALYTSDAGCGGTFTMVGCNDDFCHSSGPSRIGPIALTAGQQYYLMAGNWSQASCSTAGIIDNYEIRIEQAFPPANDVCGGAIEIGLNSPVVGNSNALTNNNYQVNLSCFTSAGQIPSTQVPNAGAGRDVVFKFTAPDEGDYSFYVEHYSVGPSTTTGPNSILYVSGDCPAGDGEIPNCLYAANRAAPVVSTANANLNNIGDSEEALCVHLLGGQEVFPIVDEVAASPLEANFTIHARRCVYEREFNGTILGANDPEGDGGAPNSAFRGCPVEGSIFAFPGLPDIDFYTLGAPTAGSRLFAAADCDGANPRNDGGTSVNLDMRVTTSTSTLEFDDQDMATSFGTLCPNVTGTVMPGSDTYIRLNHATAANSAEPYRLHTIIRPSLASAAPEPAEPNDGGLMVGDYISGSHPAAGDLDYYAFCARKGDEMMINSDTDPTKDGTAMQQFLVLFDSIFNALPVNPFGVSAGKTSVLTASPGTLVGTSPRFSGDTVIDIAKQTDLYIAANWEASVVGLPASLGDYLYQSSLNCAPIRADLGVTKDAPLVATSDSDVVYTITLTNNGPSPALFTGLTDVLPAGATLVDFTAPDGWDCAEGAGTLDCSFAGLCFDGSAVFTVTVHVPECSGSFNLENAVVVGSLTADDNSANDVATATTVVVDSGLCDDGDFCTTGDFCDAGSCVGGGPTVCDDSNACTDDTCSGGGCVYTPDDTNTCSDANACTLNDSCSGGSCVGANPPNCNDGNNCTDDSCSPSVGCVNTCNGTCDGNVKGYGWWKRLCRGPHPSGEFISQQDVDCVNNTCTFAEVQTVEQLCAELNPDPQNDKCEQAEADFMSLMLNVCRCRASGTQPIDSHCGGNTTVGPVVPAIDAKLCDPGRTHSDCVSASCAGNEINSGQALWANSVRVGRQAGTVVISWSAPYASPEGGLTNNVHQYRVYRRTSSEGTYQQIAQVNGNILSFNDTTATGSMYQYEVLAIW